MNRNTPKIVTSEILDRQPPCDVQAEQSILAAILILPDVFDDVSNIVSPADFYDDANAKLFGRMAAMHTDGKPIDFTTLCDELQVHSEFDAIGGAAYLASVARSAPNAAHAAYHARIVRRKAEHRATIKAATEALQAAYSETSEPTQVRQRLIETIDGDAERSQRHDVVMAGQTATKTVELIRQRKANGNPPGLFTGFAIDFDDATGGLHKGEMIVMAARPGSGKTSAALQVAVNQATQDNGVLFVSMEMSSGELMTRVLCSRAKVNHKLIRSNTLSDDDIDSLAKASQKMQGANLHIIDPPSMTVADVRTAARQIRKRQGLSLVVVDYLTRLTPADRRLKRHEQVGQMSGDLKRLARELNLPVLVLAQLNRQAESGGRGRPQLSHLRDSGDIEQDADVVLFLHQPSLLKPDDPDLAGKAELICAKNRNGPVGKYDLQWVPESTEFRTPAPVYCTWQEAVTAEPQYREEFSAFGGD